MDRRRCTRGIIFQLVKKDIIGQYDLDSLQQQNSFYERLFVRLARAKGDSNGR